MDDTKLLKYTLAALAIGAVGFLAGYKYNTTSVQPGSSNTPNSILQEAVFKEQNAVIDGKVTKTEGNMLTVESKTGASGTFNLSPQAVIYKTMNSQQVATPSSGVASVELNKPAFIFLKLVSSQYQITTINYIAAQARSETLPPPPDQPLKTKSSK